MSKCWYSKNCLHIFKVCCSVKSLIHNVVIQNFVMLSVSMQSVVMLSVVILNVVEPKTRLKSNKYLYY